MFIQACSGVRLGRGVCFGNDGARSCLVGCAFVLSPLKASPQMKRVCLFVRLYGMGSGE